MRTPMSVSSMNVETGSVHSGYNPVDDLAGDETPPQASTPSAMPHDDYVGDVGALSLDDSPTDSPREEERMPTPTSSALDERAREVATENQLAAYEAEEHDRVRSPHAEEAGSPPPASIEERIRHVPLTAHEVAHETDAQPIPDTDNEKPAPLEEVMAGSLISVVPGKAMAAAQPSTAPELASIPPTEARPTASHLVMTSDEPIVTSVVPISGEDAKVADAGDLEALRVEGGITADPDVLAEMAGTMPAVTQEDDEGVTADILDDFDDESHGGEPGVKCSDCQAEVPLSDLADHVCDVRPPPQQSVPSDGFDRTPPMPSASRLGAPPATLSDFVSQPQSASVPEDVGFDEDLEVLATPPPAGSRHKDVSMPVDSPPVTASVPDFAASMSRSSDVPLEESELFPDSPLDSDFPKPPTSTNGSPTKARPSSPTQQRMSDYSSTRRTSSESASSLRQRKTATSPLPTKTFDDESDAEYEGGWARRALAQSALLPPGC